MTAAKSNEVGLTRAVVKLAEALVVLSELSEDRAGLKICCMKREAHSARCQVGSALADPVVQSVLRERKGS
jgi:hypothetical protein